MKNIKQKNTGISIRNNKFLSFSKENYGNIKRSRLIFKTKKYGIRKKITTKLSEKIKTEK